MALPKFPFGRYITSKQLVAGSDMNGLFDLLTSAVKITANPGGALLNATPVQAAHANLAVVATAGDSLLLPPSYPGLEVTIENNTANYATVWPFQANPYNNNALDNIDGLTSVTHYGNSTITYECVTLGVWRRTVTVGSVNPSTEITAFGGGTNTFLEEGNIYREVIAGRNPAGTAGDYVVSTFTLSANSFDIAGRGLNMVAEGAVANNANSKRVKIYFGCTTATIGSVVTGGTVIADSGAYTTAAAVGYALEANVFKTGANGSNTQLALHYGAQIGAQVGALLVPIPLTLAENAQMLICVTANAATTATDITQNFFEINAMN